MGLGVELLLGYLEALVVRRCVYLFRFGVAGLLVLVLVAIVV